MLTEMEFFFDIDKIKTAEINKLFNGKISIPEQNITGFIHGFIDLVFKLDGKYYIVDWKSNKLGHRAEDYTDAAVEAEMKRHNYIFQYMLYAVALDRYLAMNSDGYSYERDFGGVSYVFLRGPAFYFDRPEIEIFQKFREIMSGKR
jgi:exodeoxyribonuclease V beta subunit